MLWNITIPTTDTVDAAAADVVVAARMMMLVCWEIR
jgi:hypothetical protein